MPGVDTVIGVLALLVAILALWYAREAVLPPKKRLDISVLQSTAVLKMSDARLAVSYGGTPVKEPHICTIRLQNTGTHAIRRDDFDGEPVVVAFGADSVHLLAKVSVPASQGLPKVTVEDRELRIAPSVINARQTIDVSLLTAGEPKPDLVRSHLADTKGKFVTNPSDVDKVQDARAGMANSPPFLVIVGTALGSIGIFSFFIILGVYRILPRPYELIGPHLVLTAAGAGLCAAALRRHRPSASLGLAICALSMLAIVVDAIKTGAFQDLVELLS